MKKRIIVILLLILATMSFYSCSFFNSTNKSDNSTDSVAVEANEKKQVRENIAQYVDLVIQGENSFNPSFYIKNNTNYTLESVTVTIGWVGWNTSTQEDVFANEERTVTYIPAKGISTTIDFQVNYLAKNIKGQITSIKCSAIGL